MSGPYNRYRRPSNYALFNQRYTMRDGVWLIYNVGDEKFDAYGVSIHSDVVDALRALKDQEKIAFIQYGIDLQQGIAEWEKSILEEREAKAVMADKVEPKISWFCLECHHNHVPYTDMTRSDGTAGLCLRDLDESSGCDCQERRP